MDTVIEINLQMRKLIHKEVKNELARLYTARN